MSTNTDSQFSQFQVTVDDLKRYEWQDVILKQPVKQCFQYSEAFSGMAKSCEKMGDDLGKRVYLLLYAVASFSLHSAAPGQAYGPLWSDSTGARSWIPDDLVTTDIQALRGVLDDISDHEFRARVGHVIWENSRDHKAARVAVIAFLESTRSFKTDDEYVPYLDRLECAAHVAAQIEFGKEAHRNVIEHIDAAIDEFSTNPKSGLLCYSLIQLINYHNPSSISKNAARVESIARMFLDSGDFETSECYWSLAAQCHNRIPNLEEFRRCKLEVANCMLLKSATGLKNPQLGYGYAANWMGRAVAELRQAKADQSRIADTHKRFLELQREALTECSPIEFDFGNIPGFSETEARVQEAARARVRGLSMQQAIIRLAHISVPTQLDKLRTEYLATVQDHVWDRIIPKVMLNHSGIVADTAEAICWDAEGLESEALRKHLTQHVRDTRWPIAVAWRINPARIALISEHTVRCRDLQWLINGNPLVTPGQEWIYIRGLQAGFVGDWLLSMHLLVPQIESSLRTLLQQYGVVTSTLESGGIQNHKDINQLLWMPEIVNVLGPNIVFDLRGLLIERFGHNLGNEVAHGLLAHDAFYCPASVYLWWLVLHLCWMGNRIFLGMTSQPSKANESETHSE